MSLSADRARVRGRDEKLARTVWVATVAGDNAWMPTAAEMDATAAALFEKQAAENPRRYGSGW